MFFLFDCLWGCLLNILLPQFMLAHYWKWCKQRWQKNIKKAIEAKINLYKNKYIKWNITKHYEYSNIAC